MAVMKSGINQVIFESIVDLADAGQYKTHQQLRTAILKKSAKPRQAKLLHDLDPTSQEHTLATRGVPPPTFSICDTSTNSQIEIKIKRLQERIISLQQGAPPARQQKPRARSQRCYDHAEGTCTRGERCRFVHEGAAGSGPPRPPPTPESVSRQTSMRTPWNQHPHHPGVFGDSEQARSPRTIQSRARSSKHTYYTRLRLPGGIYPGGLHPGGSVHPGGTCLLHSGGACGQPVPGHRNRPGACPYALRDVCRRRLHDTYRE